MPKSNENDAPEGSVAAKPPGADAPDGEFVKLVREIWGPKVADYYAKRLKNEDPGKD